MEKLLVDRLWHDFFVLILAVLVIIGVFAGQGLLIGLAAMGVLAYAVSWLWNKLSLEDVHYEREVSQRRVFIGEETTLTVSLVNRKPVPLGRLDIEDETPDEIEIEGAETVRGSNPKTSMMVHRTSLAWYERVRWEYKVKCENRGFYRIGPARLKSGDLFGFFGSEKELAVNDYLLVYPRIVPLPEMGMPAARPLGETRGGIAIFQDESRPSGLREYEVGDPLKIVDWKATARMQQLQVRTYEPSSSFTVILVVAVDTSERLWEGYSPVNLERVITTAASVASYATERQYSVGLFSNGTPILADRPMRLDAASAPEQLTIILETLATIMPLSVGPMAPQLAENARRFPMGSTLVVISALLQDEMVDAIEELQRQGYRVVVIYVGDGEPPVMPERVILHDLRAYFEDLELASEFGPK